MSEETIPVSISDLKTVVEILADESRTDGAVEQALWIVNKMIAENTLPPRTPEEERELQRIYDAEWYDIQVMLARTSTNDKEPAN